MLIPEEKKEKSYEVLKNKDFRNFVLGRFFVTMAIQMQMTTIGLQVYYEHSRDEFTLGLIGLCEAIPFIIFSLYSGHVADNVSRKKIILLSIIGLFGGTVLLFVNCLPQFSYMKEYGVMPLFCIVVLFGIIRSFISASTGPFLAQLVPRKHYTSSSTWNSTVWHLSAILGPVLAATIYGYQNALDAKSTYFINGILFLIGIIAFTRISSRALPEKLKKESIIASLKEGISFVFKTKNLMSALSLDLFAVLFGGAVAILPAFNDKILHAGPEAYGLLRTAPAIGAVLMAGVLSIYPPGKNAGKSLLWSVIAFGLFTILFGLSQHYWVAFSMLLLIGAFDNISVVIRHSILQLMTPDHMRGRVSSVNNIFIGSSNEIGAFESGFAAKLMGLVPSIIFGGIMTIGVVAGITKHNPKLKDLDLNKYD